MRKLKSTLLSLMLLAAASCVPGSSPIRIVGVAPIEIGMGGVCTIDSDLFVTRGTLDASGGGDYLIVLRLLSDVDDAYTIQNNRGVDLTEVRARNFMAEQVLLSYRSTNPSITFENEAIPLAAVVPAGSEDTRISTDIIGDKAAARLRDMLTDRAVTTQLTVNIQLRGHLESGETVTTNVISFPIEVNTTNQPCPEPGSVVRDGPCGVRGGQDGKVPTCCPAGSPPSGC